MVLTTKQIEAYEHDGYLIVRDVFEAERVRQLISAADEFALTAQTLTANTNMIELDPAVVAAGAPTDDGRSRLLRIKSPHLHHATFARMLAEPAVVGMVEQLIGPDIRWHHTKVNAKQPRGSGHVEWHADWGYYPHTNCDLLEVTIPLDPSVEANGCVRVLPGSHRGPALDHSERGVFVGAVPPGSFPLADTVPIELEPGDVSIHHVRLLHGSGPNATDRQRRLLLQGYAAADAWPLMAHHQPSDWPEWDARMVRGRPTRDARLDHSPVKVPLPVTAALGLFETQSKMTVSHFKDAGT